MTPNLVFNHVNGARETHLKHSKNLKHYTNGPMTTKTSHFPTGAQDRTLNHQVMVIDGKTVQA